MPRSRSKEDGGRRVPLISVELPQHVCRLVAPDRLLTRVPARRLLALQLRLLAPATTPRPSASAFPPWRHGPVADSPMLARPAPVPPRADFPARRLEREAVGFACPPADPADSGPGAWRLRLPARRPGRLRPRRLAASPARPPTRPTPAPAPGGFACPPAAPADCGSGARRPRLLARLRPPRGSGARRPRLLARLRPPRGSTAPDPPPPPPRAPGRLAARRPRQLGHGPPPLRAGSRLRLHPCPSPTRPPAPRPAPPFPASGRLLSRLERGGRLRSSSIAVPAAHAGTRNREREEESD
nr:formin-like protein 5 [Aegilops tauschii subsp. strangulata]